MDQDRIRNAHIREELRMKDTQNQIQENRLTWFGHVKRRDEHTTPSSLLEKKMIGK
jgi:hypothetical protein